MAYYIYSIQNNNVTEFNGIAEEEAKWLPSLADTGVYFDLDDNKAVCRVIVEDDNEVDARAHVEEFLDGL